MIVKIALGVIIGLMVFSGLQSCGTAMRESDYPQSDYVIPETIERADPCPDPDGDGHLNC
jgi:hypothetical protein